MSERLDEIKELIKPLFDEAPDGAKFIVVLVNPYFYYEKEGVLGFEGELNENGLSTIATGILELEQETAHLGDNRVYVDAIDWFDVDYLDESHVRVNKNDSSSNGLDLFDLGSDDD